MSNGAVILQGKFPIPDERRGLLTQLATGLDREQLLWLSGYFAGVAAATPSGVPAIAGHVLGAPRLARQRPRWRPRRRPHLRSPSSRPRTPATAARSARSCSRPCRPWACRRAWSRPATTSRAKSPRKSCCTSSSARTVMAIRRTKPADCMNSSAPSVRRNCRSCSTRCCPSAIRVIRNSAKPGAWSTSALPSSARSRLLPRVDCDVDFEKLATTWADDALARVREHAEKLKPAGGSCHCAGPPPRRRRRSPS